MGASSSALCSTSLNASASQTGIHDRKLKKGPRFGSKSSLVSVSTRSGKLLAVSVAATYSLQQTLQIQFCSRTETSTSAESSKYRAALTFLGLSPLATHVRLARPSWRARASILDILLSPCCCAPIVFLHGCIMPCSRVFRVLIRKGNPLSTMILVCVSL